MLKSFAERFNNTNSAINWLKRESPDDQIVFVSAATAIETSSISSIKWYQRLSAQRVTLVLTKSQMALKKNLVAPFTVSYVFIISLFLVFFIMGQQLPILLMAFLAFLDLSWRLSYRRRIPYGDIRKIMLDARNGTRTELVIDTKGGVIHVFFTQALSPKVFHMITTRTKVVVSS